MDEAPDDSGRQATNDASNERKAILQSLFRDLVSVQIAAEQLASTTLKESNLEEAFFSIWQTVLVDVKETSDHHILLSELLVAMAHLPPAQDEEGKQLTVADLRVWDEIPCFAWELYDDWSYYARRKTHVNTFVNVNRFAAQILRTPQSISSGPDFLGELALWLMRGALEYPQNDRELAPLETHLPAIVVWVSTLGQEIFSWDYEFPSGKREGDPGVGGPLWEGQHGFCKGRWKMWKQRLTELSSSNELSKELRELAAEGVAKMGEAEVAAV